MRLGYEKPVSTDSASMSSFGFDCRCSHPWSLGTKPGKQGLLPTNGGYEIFSHIGPDQVSSRQESGYIMNVLLTITREIRRKRNPAGISPSYRYERGETIG